MIWISLHPEHVRTGHKCIRFLYPGEVKDQTVLVAVAYLLYRNTDSWDPGQSQPHQASAGLFAAHLFFFAPSWNLSSLTIILDYSFYSFLEILFGCLFNVFAASHSLCLFRVFLFLSSSLLSSCSSPLIPLPLVFPFFFLPFFFFILFLFLLLVLPVCCFSIAAVVFLARA